jgi:hypothetical protein
METILAAGVVSCKYKVRAIIDPRAVGYGAMPTIRYDPPSTFVTDSSVFFQNSTVSTTHREKFNNESFCNFSRTSDQGVIQPDTNYYDPASWSLTE